VYSGAVSSIFWDRLVACFDDYTLSVTFLGVTVHRYNAAVLSHKKIIIAIGDNQQQKGFQIIDEAILQDHCVIGRHSIVNIGAIIDHDRVVGDYCHIAPSVTLLKGLL
jgi:UDP-3-O-[3-hydroxymyristoyl] glucosamine N-acyltransferase